MDVGLESGNSDTREVEPGSAPVIFRSTVRDRLYETVEVVVVEKGEDKRFTITDSTSVTRKDLTTSFSVRDIALVTQTKTHEKGSDEEKIIRYNEMKGK